MTESAWRRRYPLFLLFAHALVWAWAAYKPLYFHDWLLENILVAAADGTVAELLANKGASLAVDQPIMRFE